MPHQLKLQFEKMITITDAEFEYVLSHFSYKKLKKHQFLVQIDDYVPNDFFVLKGLLKSYHLDENGKMYIVQFAMQDWWITDYQAFYNQNKATLHIDCLEDVEVLCLSLENREKICSELHIMEHYFRKKSNMGYVLLQQRILSFLSSNAKERFETLLILQPDLFQRVSKSLIASYLGVSRETLSRFAK
ncbi:Crp/Fnr family transcriptional regulator [Flavobacterium branchiophilum]|uniref:Crp/Fnr family transcriptional regulator n=2 Tax=Flavobacterium branchiophilum TaxID=55197 RepID=A0A2H3KRN2_9FLAO|nr:Crp/Fnr family transcriptional regulator [Flavobacterium branchiophilum]